MASILLDQNIPVGLRHVLPGHDVRTAWHMGWAALANGELIAAAERAGFQAMITADQSLRRQQNLEGCPLAFVVLSSNNWPLIRRHLDAITAALLRAEPGEVEEVVFGDPPG